MTTIDEFFDSCCNEVACIYGYRVSKNVELSVEVQPKAASILESLKDTEMQLQ
jgi:hypothetical protein